jgi:peptide/nickel transport system permease protein
MPGSIRASSWAEVVTRATPTSPWRIFWHRFRRHPAASVALIVLIVLAALAILAGPIAQWRGIDPDAVDLLRRFEPPSAQFWLGTDELGRDLFVRVLYGGQVSLSVGVAAAVISAVLGSAIGLWAGYAGGAADAVLMRFTDAMIALPILPLLIVLAAVDLTKLGIPASIAQSPEMSLYQIVLIVSLFAGWTTVARLVRGMALSLKERDFVRAARALGAHPSQIVLRHILPNSASPIIVATTLSIGNIILFESVLSFLNLGVRPPNASWGNMLSNAQELIWSAPALAVYPGLLIFLTVMAFNFVGDGLQDALDPRATK